LLIEMKFELCLEFEYELKMGKIIRSESKKE
jgi:hypothetical protein